ncbi:MAG TPA: nuclear transport factor 2 family protein [Thermoanaerobaculia bacterium]|nr:nuclear transport factor 2 family protein [Thermoanaerobaculia bacterium]
MQNESERAARWAERYFRSWKTKNPDDVRALFTEDAVYYYGPFRPPARGREEIVRRWVSNAAQANVHCAHEVVAVSGAAAVIHWSVSFDQPAGRLAMDGVLIVQLNENGLCYSHREWYVEETSPAPG